MAGRRAVPLGEGRGVVMRILDPSLDLVLDPVPDPIPDLDPVPVLANRMASDDSSASSHAMKAKVVPENFRRHSAMRRDASRSPGSRT